jgi:hypothetical protein
MDVQRIADIKRWVRLLTPGFNRDRPLAIATHLYKKKKPSSFAGDGLLL